MKPFKPPVPVATNSLIGICVVVELLALVAGPAVGMRFDLAFGLVPARIAAGLAGGTALVPALATFITHMFLHAGLLHLGLNMLFLMWVGRYVEWVAGRGALIGIFLLGGVAGGVLQVVMSPGSLAPVVGASGGIAAVFGTYAVVFASSRAEPRTILGINFSGEMLTSLWYAASWIGLQLLTGLVFNGGTGGMGIAIWTHIGGFVTGLLLGRLWGRDAQIG